MGVLVPQGGSHAFKSQKSKVLWNGLFRDFKWLPYLRRSVLGTAPLVLKNHKKRFRTTDGQRTLASTGGTPATQCPPDGHR